MVSALSMLFICSQHFYILPYVFYNGGETLLFAYLGWFLYGCFSFTQINWKLLLFVLLSGWVGFFSKSAFLWMYASGLCCLWITISNPSKQMVPWLKNGIAIAIPAVLSLATIYKFFLARGANPASASPGFRFTLEALGFPLASPLISGFSIDEMLNGLIYHSDKPILSQATGILMVLLLAVISILLIGAIVRFVPYVPYKIALLTFYGVSILFFAYVFLHQMEISYEARHFRIVGLLAIPGAIYLFTQFKTPFKVVFILGWLIIAFFSVRLLISGLKYNLNLTAYGPSGFSQPSIDKPSLKYLQMLDQQNPGKAIFVFVTPDLGLDVMHNRFITLETVEQDNIDTYHDDYLYSGHSNPLYILLPASYSTNGKVTVIRNCFPDYNNFTVKKLSKNYILVTGE
jgi:hypothetical protein